MFAKSFSALAVLALGLSLPLQALGHALIEPAIGVKGTGARSDVQRPSKNSPCGSVNVASVVASSTPVKANGNSFTVNVQNFNAGQDGSTQIASTTIDTTGTGKSFTGGSATITKNGVLAPPSTGTVQVTGTLPAGTKCTGGSDKASCLVSFTTAGGFGNCVLISQGGAAAGGAAAADAATPAATSAAPAASTTTKAKGGNKKASPCKAQGGTRAARSLKEREAVGELDLARRDEGSWVWAA